MRKYLKYLPIIFVIVVVATLLMLSDMNKKVEKMQESKENIDTENILAEKDKGPEIIENVTNEIFEGVENKVTNIEKNPSTISEEKREEITTIDNKVKAVRLVKDKYGDDMEYFCDSVLSTGEFIVAAKVPGTTSISAYYKVNLETGSVYMMF